MSVSGFNSPVPTSASTRQAASSARARRDATCWGTANPALAWSVCPAMKVTHLATEHPNPLLSAAHTSDGTTTWPPRATTATQMPQGGTTRAGDAEHLPHRRASSLASRGLSPGVAPA